MVYLIRTTNGKQSLLKIGFTDNLRSRMKYYRTANPFVELLDVRDGDKTLESYLHEYFKKYKYEDLKEWFYENDEIIKNFSVIKAEEYNEEEGIKFQVEYTRYHIARDLFFIMSPREVSWYTEMIFNNHPEIEQTTENVAKINKLCKEMKELVNLHHENFLITNFPILFWRNTNYLVEVNNPFIDSTFRFNLSCIISSVSKYYIGDYLITSVGNGKEEILKTPPIPEKIKRENFCDPIKENYRLRSIIFDTYYMDYSSWFGLNEDYVKEGTALLKDAKNKRENYRGGSNFNMFKSKILLSPHSDTTQIMEIEIDPDIIFSNFKVGEKYSNKDAKEMLGKIFIQNEIKATPKASILAEKWFNTKIIKLKNLEGIWVNGFKIVGKKDNSQNTET